MRGRVARNAFALGSAGLVVLGIAACNQSKPEAESSQTPLKIVEQVQIDENGKEVKTAEGAAPADPAGDGKATCPPVSIAMAGALNGPDAALGINIKNGVQMAIDKHNAANPGCQVQLKPFDTEGDPQKATAIAPQSTMRQHAPCAVRSVSGQSVNAPPCAQNARVPSVVSSPALQAASPARARTRAKA